LRATLQIFYQSLQPVVTHLPVHFKNNIFLSFISVFNLLFTTNRFLFLYRSLFHIRL
jgi:hypothetical protein